MKQPSSPLHSLLLRQIKKYFPSGNLPEEIRPFVEAVSQAYFEFDQDRNMLERSLEFSSQELFQANADIRALFEAFPDLLFRIDSKGTILDCKSGKSADLYLSPEELTGKKIQDGLPENSRREFEKLIHQGYETKKAVSFEYEMHRDGKTSYFEARILPFIENQLMVVVRNVDERKKVESQLMQSRKMESVGQLAAGVAHEINNPMGVILGFAQSLLRRVAPGSEFEKPLQSIEREALRCKQLVLDLLTFSRGGKAEQSLQDVNSAIEGAYSLIAAQSRVKNITMENHFAENLPQVMANHGHIQQIVINLCTNAIDAMENAGKLTLQTRKVNREGRDWVEISVTDTGPGIPPAIQERIFEPFFTTKAPGKGTGLGLSLIYELVQKHSGKIELESFPGKGARFRVLFPSALS